MKKIIRTAGLFIAGVLFFHFSPRPAFAGCDCVDTTWQAGAYCSQNSDCTPYCSVHCEITPNGFALNLVYIQEARCRTSSPTPTCYHTSCGCDTCSEAQSQCSSGGGFDEPAPECADTPLEFYAYGKSVTYLIENASFEEHGPAEGARSCTGCRDWGCPGGGATIWDMDGHGWETDSDAGARNDCPYGNDGPRNPGDCDPPEAGCYNQCGPKQGSWQIGTKGGDKCEWATDKWCCRQRDEREGWRAEQLISGLNPGSEYLLLVRSRGKGKGYGGSGSCTGGNECWGEGWVKTRLQSVRADSIRSGEYIWFAIGDHTHPNGDATFWDPTITFTDSSGTATEYRPWDISDEDFSTQGPIWYYKGPGDGTRPGGNLTYNSSNKRWYNPSWPTQIISKTRMTP